VARLRKAEQAYLAALDPSVVDALEQIAQAARRPSAFKAAVLRAEMARCPGDPGAVILGILDVLTRLPLKAFLVEVRDAAEKRRRKPMYAAQLRSATADARKAWSRADREGTEEADREAVEAAMELYDLRERLGKQRPTSSKISVSSTVKMGLHNEPPHLTPEKVEAERRRQLYGKERSSPDLALDNPSRSTALTDFLLVPLVQLLEADRPPDLSDSAIAGLVREIARSFLPTSIGQALTADNVRKRVDAELRRRIERPRSDE
jgi:hypothetical protein